MRPTWAVVPCLNRPPELCSEVTSALLNVGSPEVRWVSESLQNTSPDCFVFIDTNNAKVISQLFGCKVCVQAKVPQLILYLKTELTGILLPLVPPECLLTCSPGTCALAAERQGLSIDSHPVPERP